MEILISVGLFAVGLVILIFGADSLVRGASSIAKAYGLSALFIGLTIVSFGTSMPELVVNVVASFRGSSDIAIGNILGSNVSNILLILGISASIYPLTVRKGTITKAIPFSFLAVAILFILVNDALFEDTSLSILSRGDGLILLSIFVVFLYYTFGISKTTDSTKDNTIKKYKYFVSTSMIVGGIVGLAVGGQMLVEGAIGIANFFGLSEALIGLTVVAIGTSIPELATSAIAAMRRQSDIAVGNIIGSNIFNILWILGISSVIRPLTFSVQLNFDIIVVMAITILLITMMFVGKRNILQRWQGTTLVSLYIIYLIYLVLRG